VRTSRWGDTEFWHYSQLLASQCRYVATILSAQIRNAERNSDDFRTITFPDIAPSQWERMVRFLNDPKSIKVEDATELARLYDRYDFPIGIEICDEILSEKAVLMEAHSMISQSRINALKKLF